MTVVVALLLVNPQPEMTPGYIGSARIGSSLAVRVPGQLFYCSLTEEP